MSVGGVGVSVAGAAGVAGGAGRGAAGRSAVSVGRVAVRVAAAAVAGAAARCGSVEQRGVIGHGGSERPGCGGRGRGEHGGVVAPRKVVPYPSPMPMASAMSTESKWRARTFQIQFASV